MTDSVISLSDEIGKLDNGQSYHYLVFLIQAALNMMSVTEPLVTAEELWSISCFHWLHKRSYRGTELLFRLSLLVYLDNH